MSFFNKHIKLLGFVTVLLLYLFLTFAYRYYVFIPVLPIYIKCYKLCSDIHVNANILNITDWEQFWLKIYMSSIYFVDSNFKMYTYSQIFVYFWENAD